MLSNKRLFEHHPNIHILIFYSPMNYILIYNCIMYLRKIYKI